MRAIAPVTKKLDFVSLQLLIHGKQSEIWYFGLLFFLLAFGFKLELTVWVFQQAQIRFILRNIQWAIPLLQYKRIPQHKLSFGFFAFWNFNILFSLLNTLKVNFLKQVSGATRALEYTPDLPKFPDTYDMPKERALDVFDFLHYVFGFQVHTIFFSLPEPLHSQWKGVFLLDGNILLRV
jgi:hypothetical protein